MEQRIREGLEGVTLLELEDLTGTRDHYRAVVVASAFEGLNRVQQHQAVYAALGELMDGPVHALSLTDAHAGGLERSGEMTMGDVVRDRIQALVDEHAILLFMKGTRTFPQCGFSHRAVEILKRCEATFETVNVLEDPDIRQGIKSFANWPTIPQLYVDGKFIGGSDILMEMFESGELQPIIDAVQKA